MVAAARTFAASGFDLIEDASVQAIVENIRQDMAENVYKLLVDRGLQLWNGGNRAQAMECMQASLVIRPDNPAAIYYVGRLHQDNGDQQSANTMFDQVIREFPESEYAEKAANAKR